LINNGLNVPDHPELGSWSGRFKKDGRTGNVWVEDVDNIGNYAHDPDPRMAALYRWRPAWQADFAARLDWCVKSFSETNHEPEVGDVLGKRIQVPAGKTVKLSARKASDPDGDDLDFKWYFYPEEGSYSGDLPHLHIKGKNASFTAPDVSSKQTLHVILEVTDNGEPALTTYRRFIIMVEPH
jgi:hypothetical protein